MPVPLDEIMRQLPPDRRAEIERNASTLAAEQRKRLDETKPEPGTMPPSARVAVGARATTGQPCPESGIWGVENSISDTMPIAAHNVMPPYRNRAVIWVLIQHA